MHNYDDRLELAPRDVVSHAIILESRKLGSTDFYLDITRKDPEFLKNRFPMIYRNLLKQGYDLTKDRIPVFPCQHYLMGGINVDSYARTKVEDVYKRQVFVLPLKLAIISPFLTSVPSLSRI